MISTQLNAMVDNTDVLIVLHQSNPTGHLFTTAIVWGALNCTKFDSQPQAMTLTNFLFSQVTLSVSSNQSKYNSNIIITFVWCFCIYLSFNLGFFNCSGSFCGPLWLSHIDRCPHFPNYIDGFLSEKVVKITQCHFP